MARIRLRLPGALSRVLSRALPSALLDRLRLLASLIAVIIVGGVGTQLDDQVGMVKLDLARGAFGLLVAGFVLVYVRRAPTPIDVVLVPIMLAFGGSCLDDPLVITGCCVVTAIMYSLYGGTVGVIIRSALIATVPVLSIALHPVSLGRTISWHAPQVLILPGMIVFIAALNRGLFTLVQRLNEALAREALLARMGSQLLPSTEINEVYAIAEHTAAALHAATPELGMVIARLRNGDLVSEIVTGVPGLRAGSRLPASLATGEHVVIAVPQDVAAQFDEQRRGPTRRWQAISLAGPGVRRVLLVGGHPEVPPEVANAYRTLAVQMTLAEADCGSHAELLHRALHDPLTGLPNRTRLFERIATVIDASRGMLDPSITAVLIVDLDDFKQVNDCFGHAAGDEVLVEAAQRIAAAGRRITEATGGECVPARLGGDEFALLLTGFRDPTQPDRIAADALARIRAPFPAAGTIVTIGASIGLARAVPSLTAADLMRCADIAMYSAKARGKNRVERFTESSHGDIATLRLIEDHLPHAIGRGEVVVYYQPIIEQEHGRCVAVEALARWRHPALGTLAPTIFIPIAERTGQILALGAFILDTACAEAAMMATAVGREIRVAVNVSARQLADPGFAAGVARVLVGSGLPATSLTLELTESQLIDEHMAVEQLVRVADLGVQIAVDDFGTGYASIGTLRNLPLHQIKIDRSFLACEPDSADAAIFDLIVSTGRALGLETVAEGVESAEQAVEVRSRGASLAQGFFYARPMPIEETIVWINERAASRVEA